MRPAKVALWGCALLALVWASPAQAAWNNVFQVCCNSCQQSTIAASPFTSNGPQPGQQNCTTRYIQRSCYQPVTTYRRSFYVEPVTTFKTSFFYEPVTSYRMSCKFDPCTCRYQQVATPCTSFRLRQQTCPVTSYLQRSCLQPVTTYQQMNYYVPETTCCNTTIGAPIPALPPGAMMGPGAGPGPGQGLGQGFGQGPGPGPGISSDMPPGVGEQRIPGGAMPPMNSGSGIPGVGEERLMPSGGGASYERNYSNPKFGTPYPTPSAPAIPVTPMPSARIRLDRTASLNGVNVRGQLVSAAQQPLHGTRVLFVSADQDRLQVGATTGNDGRFDLNLASGNWLVYTPGLDGKPRFNQKVYVQGNTPRSVLLVSHSR